MRRRVNDRRGRGEMSDPIHIGCHPDSKVPPCVSPAEGVAGASGKFRALLGRTARFTLTSSSIGTVVARRMVAVQV